MCERASCWFSRRCNRTIQLRKDGTLISHKTGADRCAGSGGHAAEPAPLASWLPVRPGLTPQGLRHGHQTWLDDLGVRYVLQAERMEHEVPGMRGVYTHITDGMRSELGAGLQQLWQASLHKRALISGRSAVPTLDKVLAAIAGPPLLAREVKAAITTETV